MTSATGGPTSRLPRRSARLAQQLTSVAVAAILAGLGIVLGLILLIVPGLVLLTWWAVIIPVVVLENSSAGEAFTPQPRARPRLRLERLRRDRARRSCC